MFGVEIEGCARCGGELKIIASIEEPAVIARISMRAIRQTSIVSSWLSHNLMSTVIIRPAKETDVPALVILLRRSWLTTWAPEVPFHAVQAFAAGDPARKLAETKWGEFTVAEIDGAVAGVLHIEENRVQSIQLAPELKRRGIGSLLMEEAEQRIRENHSEARLDVRAFNKGAIDFYRQRGWIEARRYEGTECSAPVETIEMVKALR